MTRANIQVLRDPRTFAMGATVLLGDSIVSTDENDCPTAYTDGVNKFYGEKFCAPLNIKQMVYLVLHENFHVLKMDLSRHLDLIKEDAQLANVAMDYVINNMIEGLNIWDMIERPPGALVDPKFIGWSVREVYRFLKTGRNKDGQSEGTPQPQDDDGNPMPQNNDGDGDDGEGDKPSKVEIGGKTYSVKEMDKHDSTKAQNATPEEAKTLERQIQQVIEQATMMAGVAGTNVPLEIQEVLAPKVDWKQVMDEFVQAGMRGDDDMTFRRYDRRHIVDEHYMPTMYNERIGTLLLCMDASGSTMGPILGEFCSALASLVERCRPERIRILHWDTQVNHDEVLTENEYLDADMKKLLNPRGGGGTQIGPVSDYILNNRIDADVCLIMTDGYIDDLRWASRIPTLWLVTQCESFTPPNGRMVHVQ
jgi:hypothetical protein